MSREQLFVSKYKCMCNKCFRLHDMKIEVSIDHIYPFTNHDTYLTFDEEEIDEGTVACKSCGSTDMALIDEKISAAVQELNKKGYYTLYSCEGHLDNVNETTDCSSLPYIMFTKCIPVSMFEKLPDGWYVDLDNNLIGIAIYYTEYNEDDSIDINFDENELLNWVQSLPRMIDENDQLIKHDQFMQMNAIYGACYPDIFDIDRTSMYDVNMIALPLRSPRFFDQMIAFAEMKRFKNYELSVILKEAELINERPIGIPPLSVAVRKVK